MALEVALPPELQSYLEAKVASGEYDSLAEALNHAVRLLQEQDAVDLVRLERLRQAVQLGLDEADRGELSDAESVFRRLEAKITQDLTQADNHAPLHATG